MKALIIDEPWISLILRGEKIWEMRRTACHQRGQIGLIRKGSGQVVGVADIAGSLSPIEDPDAYQATEPKHRIPQDRQARAFSDGWRTPWIVENARALLPPVHYAHPSGAVIWVNLDENTTAAVASQIELRSDRARPIVEPIKALPEPSIMYARATSALNPSPPRAGTVREVVVTGGNLRNNHIYLPLDFFPTDAIGGSNKREVAPRSITVMFKPGATVETDIDRAKRILRARAQVGDFLTRSGIREGEKVRITCTSPYTYEFSKVIDV